MKKEHALLSASSAHRWLVCTKSPRLEESIPEETSIYAKEGQAAHELAEYKINKFLGKSGIKPVSEFDSDELEEYTDMYVEYAGEIITQAYSRDKNALVLVEQRLEYEQWAPEGFGTVDLLIAIDGMLNIIDFKFGKGVKVNIDDPQTKLYALGAVDMLDMIYGIKKVRIHIFQPRIDNIEVQELDIEELLEWGENVVRPKALLAFTEKGEYVAGEHCRFCNARKTCRARTEDKLALAKHEFKKPDLLDDREIEEILTKINDLRIWVEDVYTYATEKAIKEGKKWPGLKLVEGRTNRVYTDESKVAETVLSTGKYTEDQLYTRKLIGISMMEKLLKKEFEELLDGLVEKPTGKPTLVLESDKRSEITSSAKLDFKN